MSELSLQVRRELVAAAIGRIELGIRAWQATQAEPSADAYDLRAATEYKNSMHNEFAGQWGNVKAIMEYLASLETALAKIRDFSKQAGIPQDAAYAANSMVDIARSALETRG